MEIGVEKQANVTFTPDPLKDPDTIATMSMFVVKIQELQALYREVHKKPDSPVNTSCLAYACSDNGLEFVRTGEFPVKPSENLQAWDSLAVEDPTIVITDEQGTKTFHVFHSAVKPKSNGEGVYVAIQHVSGEDLTHLENKSVILTPEGETKKILGDKLDMVKEPEFFYLNGKWYMFFEHTGRGKSEIAMAESDSLTGPYKNIHPLLQTRENLWDSQHLSPGPIIPSKDGKDFLMLYNGRGEGNSHDKNPSWSIGYLMFNPQTGLIYNRAESPIITPLTEIGPDNQLIAFANSAVTRNGVASKQTLYYTVGDKRMMLAHVDINNL